MIRLDHKSYRRKTIKILVKILRVSILQPPPLHLSRSPIFQSSSSFCEGKRKKKNSAPKMMRNFFFNPTNVWGLWRPWKDGPGSRKCNKWVWKTWAQSYGMLSFYNTKFPLGKTGWNFAWGIKIYGVMRKFANIPEKKFVFARPKEFPKIVFQKGSNFGNFFYLAAI